MEILAKKGDILSAEADLIVVGMYENEDLQNDFLTRLDVQIQGKLKRAIKTQQFEAKVGQNIVFAALDRAHADFILIIGAGKESELSANVIREIGGVAIRAAKRLGSETIALEFFGEDQELFQAKSSAQALSEAMLMADYQFLTYKKDKQKSSITYVTLIAEDGRDARQAEKGIEDAYRIVEGVSLARDLVNSPAKDITPHALSLKAEEIARNSHGRIKVKIFNREQCERKKMGAYLAVAQGTQDEPQFIHLTYTPEGKPKKRIAIIGKGVTFDSGGLSLKPASSMETMKCDMAGAASVLGCFMILAGMDLDVEVHGIIPATENLPSDRAIKPGDIVRASNGKTIEILNTDAEGRLTLADALVYAGKLEPDYIVDLATLTGACVVALGEEIGATMSNNPQFGTKVLGAAALAGEKMWELPLEARYRILIESEVADLRNVATSRYGGSLTAGLFLQEFVPENTPWVHMDIAGPAFAERPLASYIGKGGTGFGVRTLIQLIQTI